jgi:hypothetical protein
LSTIGDFLGAPNCRFSAGTSGAPPECAALWAGPPAHSIASLFFLCSDWFVYSIFFNVQIQKLIRFKKYSDLKNVQIQESFKHENSKFIQIRNFFKTENCSKPKIVQI